MDSWSRTFFKRTNDARLALERKAIADEARRERLYVLGKPGAGTVHGGGTSDPMRAVDAYVDAQEGSDGLDWARDTLVAFDALVAELRASCRGEVLTATWAIEYRYRLGLTERQAAKRMGCAPTTVRRWVATIADYLDHIGPSAVPSNVRS